MNDDKRPSLREFLSAADADVAAVAPATVVFAPGGTRRAAALQGISPQSDDYARWTRERMIACSQRFFQLGVRHLFMSVMRPAQLAEIGRYRERLLFWLDSGLAGEEALADYARLGWRVRLVGGDTLPELARTNERLRAATARHAGPTLWFYVVPEAESPWQWVLSAIRRGAAATVAEAIEAIYGEPVPLATLYLAFGKPILVPDLLPPLLMGEAQSYWFQTPGYDIEPQTLRRIVYDYAYLRQTWAQDKSSRYADMGAYHTLLQQPLVLGLGRRVGPFWYPEHDQQPNIHEGDL